MAARIVLSDLDGTLLDARTYDWRPARAALARLKKLGVPVILTSSKTRAEIEEWRRILGNHEVFVSENGGGVYFPERTKAHAPDKAEPWDGYHRIVLGAPYDLVRIAFEGIRRETALLLRGFGDMPLEEVEDRTGLEGEDAERAQKREFDEPFVWESMDDTSDQARIAEAAQARGLRVSRGGRFFHLHGAHDKGACVRAIALAYGEDGRPARTMGVGDSDNDWDLLAAVDEASVVARPDGSHALKLLSELAAPFVSDHAGPAGFAEAIESWFPED
jgi:mannosyl-3-phosphoglycerate phosphatase